MKKSDLREAILAKLRAELASQTAAAHLARDEAISEESRPENKYDTHSQEAAYLAEGQARIANEISQSIAQYIALPLAPAAADTPVAIGMLVSLRGASGTTWYFVGPRAGGVEVQVDGCDVLVITPQSPLGRAMMGKRIGDSVQLPGRAGTSAIATIE